MKTRAPFSYVDFSLSAFIFHRGFACQIRIWQRFHAKHESSHVTLRQMYVVFTYILICKKL